MIVLMYISMFAILPWSASALADVKLNSEIGELQTSSLASGPHIELELISDFNRVSPGQNIQLAVKFMPEKEWHTYWRNPGDSGEAPTINLTSSVKLDFGDIQWPLPSAIPVAHLMNYGYEGTNILSIPASIPNDVAIGSEIVITADVSWLVCKEDCIPGWATLQITLDVTDDGEHEGANEIKRSEQYSLFEQNKQLLPQNKISTGKYEVTDEQIVIETAIPENSLPQTELPSSGQWRLFPFRSDLINHASEQVVTYDDDKMRFIIPKSAYYNHKSEALQWLASNGRIGYYLNTSFNQATGFNGAINTESTSENESSRQSIFVYILMAFTGGLILNLMPCVLPILSIKALALQNIQAGWSHKLAYLFGVLFCFNAFALTIVIMQNMGQQIGWGFHMQSPSVVVLLAFLFTFIALVLFDALAVASRFAGFGQSLVEGNTVGSHFATGALAVIVASPCTAPFMAAALGIALVSEPYVTFILFNALAIGFALPLTLLFMSKKALKFLPKPGAWMETFKHFLAFPMLLTVAWLVWVFAGQVGSYLQFLLLLSLILFSMFAWALGRSNHGFTKLICTLGLFISIAAPISLSVNSSGATNSSKTQNIEQSGLQSIPYTQQTLASLRNEKQIVFVNMTADWCITCKVNEQVALTNSDVIEALSQTGVHYVVGDWTNKNAEILNYLSQYERAGVPLYVVYAGNQKGKVLPQILTPNMVINAINKAKEDLQK